MEHNLKWDVVCQQRQYLPDPQGVENSFSSYPGLGTSFLDGYQHQEKLTQTTTGLVSDNSIQ